MKCRFSSLNARHMPRRNKRGGEMHGMTGTRPYKIWLKILDRCYNKNHKFYSDYGGRGIVVCDKWRHSFSAFWNDMRNGYFPEGTMERIDVNAGYSPNNCRWATRAEQMHNRRDNLYLTLNGKRQRIQEWCADLKLNRQTVISRLHHGWTEEDALTRPVQLRAK